MSTRADLLPAFFEGLDRWTEERRVPSETRAYGDHPDQVVELRGPSGRTPRGCALVLHGGFWRSGYTRQDTKALATALACDGWVSANVEYRRLGVGAYRPMLEDVTAARRLLGDVSPVIAVGHSAGGHLALWLAAERLVDAAVGLGAVCDLAAAARAAFDQRAVQELLGGDPTEVPDAYRLADPAARLPLCTPYVLVHGVDDDRVPVDHARSYAARARGAGDECLLIEVPAGHFELIDPTSDAWPDVLRALDSASTLAAAEAPG